MAKTILSERNVEFGKNDDLPKLVRMATKALDLQRDDISEGAPAAATIRNILSNLAHSDGIASLRNAYGTGHGHAAQARVSLGPVTPGSAVGAASTLAVFLLETHDARAI